MTSHVLMAVTLAATMSWSAAMSRQPQRAAGPAPAQREATATNPGNVPFSSNGCSGFREARFFSCCFVHDLAFWAGGSYHERRMADLSLRRCVLDISGDRIVADIGYLLVFLGQIPAVIVDDGWGRAWRGTTRRRYEPLKPEQRQLVDAERRRVCESLRLNPATGKYRVDDAREIRPNQAREVCRGPVPNQASNR